jgi:hypothetical protein
MRFERHPDGVRAEHVLAPRKARREAEPIEPSSGGPGAVATHDLTAMISQGATTVFVAAMSSPSAVNTESAASNNEGDTTRRFS